MVDNTIQSVLNAEHKLESMSNHLRMVRLIPQKRNFRSYAELLSR